MQKAWCVKRRKRSSILTHSKRKRRNRYDYLDYQRWWHLYNPTSMYRKCMTNESENENIRQIYYDNEVCYNTKMKQIIPTNFQKDKSTSDEKCWWFGGIDLLIMLKCQDKQIKISHETLIYEILKQSIAH